MIFLKSSPDIGLPSKLEVARRVAMVWLSGFSIGFAMPHSLLFPSLNLAHRQLDGEGLLIRSVGISPQPMKAVSQLRMLGQHRLHQVDIPGAAGHGIGCVFGLVVDDQVETAQRAVRV